MHERVEAEAQETPAAAAVHTLGQGAVVERMLALQRSAGNAAVNRLIARQGAGDFVEMHPTEFVFILGAKDDAGLEVAKKHYKTPLSSRLHRKVVLREEMPDPSLNGVLVYLSQFEYPISEITIVVHGNPQGDILLPLNKEDTTPERTTPDELEKALNDGVLAPLKGGQITSKTRIRLQACYTGDGPRMVNLLDKAFGEGWGMVIAPTVATGYAKDVWHSEGLSGWFVTSPKSLTLAELTVALKTKYGKSLGALDKTQYQEATDSHHKGEWVKDDDEMWAEIARNATESDEPGPDGETQWVYIASAFIQSVKPGYEDDPVLYTKSSYYYMPEEL